MSSPRGQEPQSLGLSLFTSEHKDTPQLALSTFKPQPGAYNLHSTAALQDGLKLLPTCPCAFEQTLENPQDLFPRPGKPCLSTLPDFP